MTWSWFKRSPHRTTRPRMAALKDLVSVPVSIADSQTRSFARLSGH